jgi:uncharacterized membrane protein YfcA
MGASVPSMSHTTAPWPSRGTVALLAIGLVAGFFSGVFGVGGGVLIVPLLVTLRAFPARPAMATSLAAILFTATAAAAAHAADGNVLWQDAALIGVPAVAGAAGGAWLQQRIHPRRLVLAFSAFLLAVALRLVL